MQRLLSQHESELLPHMPGYSTPANNKTRDEDDESTCTSIQNFISDLMESEEIPNSDARIIREVIAEEADILEDSLDSHWLQDDVSVDTDIKLDFSFSPFMTPQYINDDHCYTPKKYGNQILTDETSKNPPSQIIEKNFVITNASEPKCTIDRNLQNALLNVKNENFSLDDLLVTPPLNLNLSGPPTPLITNILFGDKLDSDNDESCERKLGPCIENFMSVQSNDKILEEFFAEDTKDFKTEDTNDFKTEDTKDFKTEDTKDFKMEDTKDFKTEDTIYFKTEDTKYFKTEDTKDFKTEEQEIKDHSDSKKKNILFVETDQNMDINSRKINNKTGKPVSPSETKFNITNFYCKMCNRQFKNLSALKVHCTRVHKLKIKHKNPQLRKTRICDHCGKSYYHLAQFIRHIESHSKPLPPHICKYCSLKFSSESKLKMHMTTHIGKSIPKPDPAKKYVCTVCGASSSTATNLKTHMRRHSKNYTIYCIECRRGFYRKSDLTTHYRHHTGEKPFPCEYCPRSFARRDVLNRHMKCHTDEKPYQCQYCYLRYAKKRELNAHLEKGKLCLQKRNELASEEKIEKNKVSVTYGTVVGTNILFEDFDELSKET
ncbi:uncharacterized protein [Battus philenor]|uniref:uncharacterized protein isoform X2 n=1 Tax=Battus philenor TaxID=42288 RepID=UPI0035D02EC2